MLNAEGWRHRSRVPLLMTVVACVSGLPRAAETVVVFGCSLSLHRYSAAAFTTEQMLMFWRVP